MRIYRSTFAFLLAIYVLVLIVTMMTLISICLQVIDYLCSVSLLTDEGHSVSDVEEALLLNDGKDKLARIFLQVGSQRQNESHPSPDKHTHRQTDTERQTENNHQNCHEVVTASLLPTVKDGRTDRSTLSIPFSICNIVCPGRQILSLSLHLILFAHCPISGPLAIASIRIRGGENQGCPRCKRKRYRKSSRPTYGHLIVS